MDPKVQNPTPPPPVAANNSRAPHEVITVREELDKELPKARPNTLFWRTVDVVGFCLFGFFLAVFLGLLSFCLFCFYDRLHVLGKRRRVSFFVGHIVGALGGLAWQGFVIFMFVVFAKYY